MITLPYFVTALALVFLGPQAVILFPLPTVQTIEVDRFIVSELFDRSWSEIPSAIRDTRCGAYRAGVVNHHALASDLLAGFFHHVKRCRPEANTFIILSPDHYRISRSVVATHARPYRLQGVDIKVKAADSSLATQQIVPFEREHGIGALVPFIHHEFPDATIIPLIVRADLSREEQTLLTDWLRTEMKKPGAFVVVSADMSHYLDAKTARANDQETKRALSGLDVAFFERATDDFTDNGVSIATVLEALGPTARFTLLGESISNAYKGSPGFTTSYLVGMWE
jgi:poly-gamma-glutamate synthesis protein (capsule biosynthesis protein)